MREREPPSTVQLDFVVIGAQRAGSTALADELALNTSVCLPALELPVFEPKFYSRKALATLPAYYAGCCATVRGLKRPEYLANEFAARNLADTVPNVRVVAVLRDPVERFLSAAYWYQYVRLIPIMPLADIVQEARASAPDVIRAALSGNPFAQLISNGMYGAHMNKYRDTFPDQSIMVYYQDNLRTPQDRRAVAAEIVRRCGGSGQWIEGKDTRKNAGVYDSRRLRFLSKRPTTFNWEISMRFEYVRHRLLRSPGRSAISGAFQVADRALMSRLFRRTRAERLETDALNWLSEFYTEDLHRGTWLNFPVDWKARYSVG